MTTGLVILAVLLGVGALIYGVVKAAKSQGASEQRATDIDAAAAAEEEIHAVQGEERDTAETRRRMNDGSF